MEEHSPLLLVGVDGEAPAETTGRGQADVRRHTERLRGRSAATLWGGYRKGTCLLWRERERKTERQRVRAAEREKSKRQRAGERERRRRDSERETDKRDSET